MQQNLACAQVFSFPQVDQRWRHIHHHYRQRFLWAQDASRMDQRIRDEYHWNPELRVQHGETL